MAYFCGILSESRGEGRHGALLHQFASLRTKPWEGIRGIFESHGYLGEQPWELCMNITVNYSRDAECILRGMFCNKWMRLRLNVILLTHTHTLFTPFERPHDNSGHPHRKWVVDRDMWLWIERSNSQFADKILYNILRKMKIAMLVNPFISHKKYLHVG